MANRYDNRSYRRNTGNRNADYDRYNYGQRRSGYDYDDFSSDYDRDESYFGSGMQYGQGYTGGEPGRRYESYNRLDEEYYPNTGYSNQSYTGGSYYDRDNYSGSYYNRNPYANYGERSGYYGRGSYPESERGYDMRRNRYEEDRGWWDKTADEVSSWLGDEDATRRREMDHRRGQYRGHGPRNYTRSDDRIKEDINDRLTDHPYLDASDIEVEVNNGEVTLTGTVETRNAKRIAEDITDDVSGVRNVENRIRVQQSSFSSQTGSSSYTGTSMTGTPTTTGSSQTTTGTTTGQSRSRTA